MKKVSILIPNAGDTVNIGDLAILKSLVRIIGASTVNSSLVIHCVDPLETSRELNVATRRNIVHQLVFKPRGLSKIGAVMQFSCDFLLSRISKQLHLSRNTHNLLLDYSGADLIVFCGGGYLRSTSGFLQGCNLIAQLFPFVLARLYKGRMVTAPMSFGPFAHLWHEKLSAYVLSMLDHVLVREEISYRILSKYISNVSLVPDLAFLLPTEFKKNSKKNVIGFTVRSWGTRRQTDKFIDEFSKAITAISRKYSMKVQPIVQVLGSEFGELDEAVTRRVISQLRSENVNVLSTKKNYTLSDAITNYKKIDILVGTRMHSNILAAISGTPFVSIAYEHKMLGVSTLLGVQRFCIQFETLTAAKLTKKIVYLYKSLDEVQQQLVKSVKSIRKNQANSIIKILDHQYI